MKKFKLFFAAVLILCAVLMLGACAKKSDIKSSDIVSVEIKGKDENRTVKVKAEFTEEFVEEYKGEKVYLIAKGVGEAQTYSPIDEAKVKSKVEFEIPYEENGKNHKNTTFVCVVLDGSGEARRFKPVTSEKCITNISTLGQSASRPSTSNIKGLATSDIGHASYLGVQHVLIDIRADRLLLSEYKSGAQSVVSGGLTYYFDGEYIEYLDKQISEATAQGMRVYLQFVLGRPEENPIECLYFEGTSSKSEYYLPNLSDTKAQGYICAMFEFVSQRYSGAHGVAVDYIIGKNANSPAYNDAGSADADTARKTYLAYVRMAYNVLTSHASNGQVYVSLDNAWRATTNGALSYLNVFNTNAKASGDFNWSIALSYGDISSDSAWADGTKFSEKFTADSLTELEGILGTDEFMYKTDRRSVIISSFALRRNEESENSDTRRGASYAYLYYSSLNSGIIDALIYSTYEGDNYGLLTLDGKKTALCDMMAVCSSNRIGELDSLSSLIGNEWTNIKDEDGFDKITSYYATVTDKDIKTTNPKRLFDFYTGQSYGFVPMGGADFASLSQYTNTDKSTGTYLLSNGSGDGWRVLYSSSFDKTEIDSSKYLGITLNTQASGEEFVLIITGNAKKTKDRISYCAPAKATNAPTEYFFDISEFADKLASSDVDISICVPSSETGNTTNLSVYRAALYGSSGSQVWKYVLIAIIIIVLTAVLFVVARIVINRPKKTKKKAKKTAPKKTKSKSGPKKQTKSQKKDTAPEDELIDGEEEYEDDEEEPEEEPEDEDDGENYEDLEDDEYEDEPYTNDESDDDLYYDDDEAYEGEDEENKE